ncbi:MULTISPECIES: PilZ domain-containing protein [unclassified Acinetobacter]|uniref:PilZ domain-containing protein n=1 Tax=unclassified Acinetobacter TaxID=196816 RepID=UPI00083B0806|nr:PilZ domain-containing protein [Acinetobacter sp. WCHAc010034]AYA02056.1 pilus assembly protein [Acinetobacter sp. WCHAc010034]MBL8323002.1 PilZ domain-containing protein [Acinetobacter sp.]
MQPRMGGIIQANIPDVETLFASYMPFVAGGGLFVPSKQAVKMGDEVFVLTTLPDQSQKIPLTGKVIWISQKQNGIKPQGFGIQLAGEKGVYFKSEAERLLTGLKTEGRRSYTM